jgi:pilus assembly protein CpaB
MRRGGLVVLLLGLLLIVGAGAFVFLGSGPIPGVPGGQPTQVVVPTEDIGVNVVVAKVDIPANTVISDTNTLLETVNIPTAEFDEEVNFRDSFGEIGNKLTLRDIRAGDRITKDSLTEPGLAQKLPTAEPNRARDKAYPFIVNNLSGVADQIKIGDFVDVVATFTVPRRVSYPTGQQLEEQAGQQVVVTQRDHIEETFRTTKTIVQRAQVLAIFKPQVAAEGTPEDEAPAVNQDAGPPRVDASGQPIDPGLAAEGGTVEGSTLTQGIWTVMLAINDQEVELMEFSLSTQARMVLVLRGAGDSTYEPTIGATFDLLIAEFGVPLPRPLPPRVLGEDETLTGEPTRTPAPTRIP